MLGPEAFDAAPFLELMARPESDGGYGQPWGIEDRVGVTVASSRGHAAARSVVAEAEAMADAADDRAGVRTRAGRRDELDACSRGSRRRGA